MYNLNKPFKPFHSKKGALELSINAIVILILAITMLSLGLAFMKGLFKKTTGQLEQVGEDIKNQMIEQLRTSSSKLTLTQEDITMKRGESKEIYFAVKNVEQTQKFGIKASCESALGGSSPLPEEKLQTFESTRDLEQGDVDVQKMILVIDPNVDRTTHSCSLCIGRSGARDCSYSKKSFFVTVE